MVNKWLLVGSASVGALMSGVVAWMLHSYVVGRMEARHENALTELTTKKDAECLMAKQIPNEVSNVYQKNIAGYDDAFNAYLLRANKCPPPSSKAIAPADIMQDNPKEPSFLERAASILGLS